MAIVHDGELPACRPCDLWRKASRTNNALIGGKGWRANHPVTLSRFGLRGSSRCWKLSRWINHGCALMTGTWRSSRKRGATPPCGDVYFRQSDAICAERDLSTILGEGGRTPMLAEAGCSDPVGTDHGAGLSRGVCEHAITVGGVCPSLWKARIAGTSWCGDGGLRSSSTGTA